MLLELIIFFVVLCLILICFKLYIKLTTGKCTSNVKMHGKTVIVTGSNTGIGKETALDLAARGARVILACRNLEKAERARNEIVSNTGNNNVVVKHLDLISFDSVREFARSIHETEDRLDVLINNAAAFLLGKQLTKDGLNPVMQVNYFGPFLLTNLLLDLLKRSAPSRIVNVSSIGYLYANLNLDDLCEQNNLRELIIYDNSKLCNILMSNELARRLEGTNVTSNSLHPGVIYTELSRNIPFPLRFMALCLMKAFYKNPTEGAQTTIYLAVADEVANVSGAYFMDCKQKQLSRKARDIELQKKLWEVSEKVVKLAENEKFYNNL